MSRGTAARTAGIAGLLLVVAATAGRPAAQEATSASYVLETSAMTMAGGETSSPSYHMRVAVGLAVEAGETTSASYTASYGLYNGLDADGDGIAGANDLCPTEFSGCNDTDFDGCIDVPDVDADVDGVTAGSCDCDDVNGSIWGTPGEVLNVLGDKDPAGLGTIFSWTIPADPGGTSPRYDTIRSSNLTNFVTGATCVETDDPFDTMALDGVDPLAQIAFYYLVRAENDCNGISAGGVGTSQGIYARAARDCP